MVHRSCYLPRRTQQWRPHPSAVVEGETPKVEAELRWEAGPLVDLRYGWLPRQLEAPLASLEVQMPHQAPPASEHVMAAVVATTVGVEEPWWVVR